MEHYIEEYFNSINDLDYSYAEIKGWVQDLYKQGKSIQEIKHYLMDKLDIFTDSEEQMIYERLINCMINNKKYCDRLTKEIYQ